MAKLKDIAELVGVSISTVSRVINHDMSRSVNEDTRRRIWEAVQELGYKVNKDKKMNKQKKEDVLYRVGCVLAVQQNKYNHPYYSIILEGIEKGLNNEKCRLEFIQSFEANDSSYLENFQHLVKEHNVDGVIVVEGIHPETYRWLKQNVKVVVGIDISDPEVPIIAYDRLSAAKSAVNHLIAMGHRKIGYIGGPGLHGDIRKEKRYRGYQYALHEAGLTIDPNWVINTKWDVSLSYEMTKNTLNEYRDTLPTAIFSASDMMAIPAMRAITEQHINIPEDIAFFSIDNVELSQYTSPPLSTIHVPKMEMGMIATKILLNYLNKDYTLPMKVLVPYELKLRRSSGN